MAGKIPRLSIADGLDQHHVAFKKAFLTLRGLGSIRIRGTHIRNLICSTNKQERLNGGLAGRFRYARGTNKEESPIFRMAILHHRYIRPHGGIAYRTPAGAAGTGIRGSDGWLTLVQSAAAAA